MVPPKTVRNWIVYYKLYSMRTLWVQLYRTTKVNTDVAGKKAESYMRGHAVFLLELQSHAEL